MTNHAVSRSKSRRGRVNAVIVIFAFCVGQILLGTSEPDGQVSKAFSEESTTASVDTKSSKSNEIDPGLKAFEKARDILQQRCLSCHREGSSEGQFSLSTRKSAFESGFIIPKDPDASRLWEVIDPINGESEMPKTGKPLTESEREAIREWIVTGAFWPENQTLVTPPNHDLNWWSFKPIRRPEIPVPKTRDLAMREVKHPVDAFVANQLGMHDLTFSGKADRRTLLRRLKFDLLGLPPTMEEIEEYVRDEDPKAYQKWVERFLASEHYGERWARHWLDVVKYADTCGYDKDKLRENAWPYRDYVIRSMNQDKEFRRFVREQIAGDVFYPGQSDGILGLGFISSGPWDFIGHVEVPESKLDGKVARNLDRDDMVSGAFNAFCSLTVQCARCHHHKFDPVSQEQYYSLQAIFAAVDRAERPYDTDPQIEAKRESFRVAIDEAKRKLNEIESEMRREGGEELVKLDKRFEELKGQVTVQKEPQFGYHSQMASDPSTEKWIEVDLGSVQSVSEIELLPCHDEYANIGAGFGFPIRYRVEAFDGPESADPITVADRTAKDEANPGLQTVRFRSDLFPVSARRIRVTATKLRERKGDYNFALAELRVLSADGENLARGCKVTSLDSIEAPVRWSRGNLTDGKWPVYGQPDKATELFSVSQKRDLLLQKVQTPERLKQKMEWEEQQKEAQESMSRLPQGKMVYAASTVFSPQGNFKPTDGKPREIRVLARGEISKPLAVALPGLLPLAAQLPNEINPDASESQRRAALADWLVHDSNPLVWRSIVNRVWQYHFGQGIVQTPNDFGKMGAIPTHPDLLDWLASEFRDGGQWIRRGSIKDLHRLIVTSRTYQQVSDHNVSKAERDSDNRWLWRMDRRRLEAEEIRDAIMFVSGALDLKMGGPGYRLFELERPEHSPHYEYHKFDHSDITTHRRSIYRFIVRSQPDPWMTTMDCADSSQSTPKRDETLTALQSLSLLNNQFNLVMAEKFQETIQEEADVLSEQVRVAFTKAMQRQPSEEDLSRMVAYAERHGLKNLCRFLFNFSEFIYVD